MPFSRNHMKPPCFTTARQPSKSPGYIALIPYQSLLLTRPTSSPRHLGSFGCKTVSFLCKKKIKKEIDKSRISLYQRNLEAKKKTKRQAKSLPFMERLVK